VQTSEVLTSAKAMRERIALQSTSCEMDANAAFVSRNL